MSPFQFTPIGIIHSPFKQKFGIPRQPVLASAARATLELLPPCNREAYGRGLEDFSHLWIQFVFHQSISESPKPLVRPPRLGGKEKRGVFATRSGFRPNPIGLSLVELERVASSETSLILHLKSIDLLDQTPVLDIKPYIPYCDQPENPRAEFASSPPQKIFEVVYCPLALEKIREKEAQGLVDLQQLIVQLLETDPRAGHYQGFPQKKEYGILLFDFDLRWEVQADQIRVLDLIGNVG